MSEPQKPFACTIPECSMSFTNEDHLNVHVKKHDMVLQLGLEQRNAFVADQTPTPTRFIRNCEEVGLFQDLQNVNPFDEGFKRAMEIKVGTLTASPAPPLDELHTPQMVFPAGADAMYANHRNVTISRSSSDESGAIKEYETTTISKLTNEVTRISRVIEKQDTIEDRTDDKVFKNNVIQIKSNVEIRKGVIEDHRQQIMSQASIDNVVDSLTAEKGGKVKKKCRPRKSVNNLNDYEVLIKLPNSNKPIKMKVVDEKEEKKDCLKKDTKEKLKTVIKKKTEPPKANLPILTSFGTLQPVTIVKPLSVPILVNTVHKLPLPLDGNSPKLRKLCPKEIPVKSNEIVNEECVIVNDINMSTDKEFKEQKSAASKRYRERLKTKMFSQMQENKQLKETNQRLASENAALKALLMDHIKKCPESTDLSSIKSLINQPQAKSYITIPIQSIRKMS